MTGPPGASLAIKLSFALYVILGTYLFIGAPNAIYFLTPKRVDCPSEPGISASSSDAGANVSTVRLVIAWPAFWL